MTYKIIHKNIIDKSKRNNKCPPLQLQSLTGAFEVAVRTLAGGELNQGSYTLGDYRTEPEESIKDYLLTLYREGGANMQEKWWGTFKRNSRVVKACAIVSQS